MVEISTSILNVEKDQATKIFYGLEVAHTDYFHIDVMDGKFVPKDTTELMKDYTNTVKQISNIPIDVHLMVEDVKGFIDEYAGFNPNIITFHVEATKSKEEVKELIDYIKSQGIKVGLSVKPNTKIEEIYEFLPYIHLCLVMTVEPGLGGQKLIPETLEKVSILKKYIDENNIDIDIEVDGGIKPENIEDAKNAGANIFVVGTAIVNSDNMEETIEVLRK
ncbi:MAG: ribulose-phosphate 3-epimerase [Clostridia bacterium]|nr:ribulose-phosphate 3-epimerase [Clostridia bacterium]MCI9274687.1 ribulose-phosphate 3-epimerase [Clostridia bacterium]